MNKIAVIILSYNHEQFLRDLFASLGRLSYPRESLKIFFLDNASADGSAALAPRLLAELNFEHEFIEKKENLGFAGGNNLCIRRALDESFDFVYLLNPDTEVEPDFLERAAAAMGDTSVGAAQSLLLMGDDHQVINSVGNAFHYLGFGYCLGYRDRRDSPVYAQLASKMPEITYASGAGVLLRAGALRQVGLFDETLFAYHEDADLSLRLFLAGWRIVLAPRSVVYHHYQFSRSIKKYYWMERNRFIVLWKCLRLRTLLLVLPMQLVLEAGLLLFSFRTGWWREKLRACVWFLNPHNLAALWRSRRAIQKSRRLPDRELARRFTSVISYQEIDNILLRRIGNPLMTAYWRAVRPLIRW
ncbi:glycosyltransferase family 2 protein [Patescibacteria group bacterium]|nr:MAG: glycosyltransferase family 2 protein [Patescibacteria group bacterium]